VVWSKIHFPLTTPLSPPKIGGELFTAESIRDIPSEVLLSRRDGMRNDCAVNCDHIQTVSESNIGSLITTLSGEKLGEIRNAIGFALNI
jgi:mRNA-degrading endonuclease toxin of MazEF toxin-antitoxin module